MFLQFPEPALGRTRSTRKNFRKSYGIFQNRYDTAQNERGDNLNADKQTPPSSPLLRQNAAGTFSPLCASKK